MKRSTAFLGALLLVLTIPARSQVTNLTVNGSATDFTMTSGGVVDWSFNIPAGGTAEGEMWVDVNQNHVIDPGTDRLVLTFNQTDGDTVGFNGPPDMDGLANGSVSFSMPIGFAPEAYVIHFSHDGTGDTVWADIQPLASPAFSVSGTVSGPPGADLSFIIIEATRKSDSGVPFWHGLTDSTGLYTIELNEDTAGNPWYVVMNSVPPPYSVARRDTAVVIDGHLTGIDFLLLASSAQVSGYIYTDLGDTLANQSLQIQKIDTSGGTYIDAQSDFSGRYWIGISTELLDGSAWRIIQPWSDAPITTRMLAAGMLSVINPGDSVVHDLVAYTVNSSITGTVLIDGGPPGFPIRMFVNNQDSGSSWSFSDALTGEFSIPVSDKIADYYLGPIDPGGSYLGGAVLVHPGDNGVFYDITTTGVGDGPADLPSSFSLGQNYPNPFNPVTTIPYELAGRSQVLLEVYDVLGRRVATLVDAVQEPGPRSAVFDASSLPSGVYTCRLTAGSFTATAKLVLIR